MPKVTKYDMSGKEIGTIELAESVFAIEPNKSVLHAAVINYLANQRHGTQSTKTRTEVRGGGRKPWRQKGTGNARQGSIRSPQWKGGGVALGPKPRSYAYALTKKTKRLAFKSAFSSKVLGENIIVVDSIKTEEFKTKTIVSMLNALKVEKGALIVLAESDLKVVKSANNIPNVKTAPVNALNVYDLLRYDKLVITEDAVKKLEEVYA